LRVVRGVSWLVLGLAVVGAAAVLADTFYPLPGLARGGLLAAWAALGCGTLYFALLRPLARRLDAAHLASAVESEHPELGERLTTTVELAGRAAPHNGAPALIGLLARDAELRARDVDFADAAPSRGTGWLVAAAGVALIAAVAPGVAWPNGYGTQLRRFFLPFYEPAVDVGFAVVANPGDTAVGKGRELVLTAFLDPKKEGVVLPARATLVQIDARGNRKPLVMEAKTPSEFVLKLSAVEAGFRYRVEAGAGSSPLHTVTAVDPVGLAADSPAVAVTPPEYARKTVESLSRIGTADFAALQYSQVAFDFHFDRPARGARLVWTPPAVAGEGEPVKTALPLKLSDDGLTAHFETQAVLTGAYALVTEADFGVETNMTASRPSSRSRVSPRRSSPCSRPTGCPSKRNSTTTWPLPL
jgi:hypothetical protein